MELKRIAVEILAIQIEMDELIEKWADNEGPEIKRRICEKLLDLKRKKDSLRERV